MYDEFLHIETLLSILLRIYLNSSKFLSQLIKYSFDILPSFCRSFKQK
jgi:hypothetical protein